MRGMNLKADEAATLLAQLAHPQRLRLLCHLVEAERSVTNLVEHTGLTQPAVSQHLKRLRDAGLVATRREGQIIHYSLADIATEKVLNVLHDIYC